ncbi:hypothetical protein JOD15_001685 [Enterococcus ureilyticus]|nr:hypothetical protein [Enterococcus ureilyticus]
MKEIGLDGLIDISRLKNKSVSFDWECMFAKTGHNYQLQIQGTILALLAKLAQAGKIAVTVGKTYTVKINAANLKKLRKMLKRAICVRK